MIKLAVFDLDDTIFLTEEAVFHMENEIVGEMGFPPMTRETHKKNWGKKLREAIQERVPGIDADEFLKRIPEKLKEHVEMGKVDVVRGEVLQALDLLRKEKIQLAVLTARSKIEVGHLLHQEHPITSRMTKLYHLETLRFHKPDPRVFDLILKEHGVLPEETIYVGDALSDGLSAKGAGVKFVAYLEGGVKTESDFSDIKPDFFAYSFTQVAKQITQST